MEMNDENAPDKLYAIGEVSEMVGVPLHLLRQWEERFPQLRPQRLRTGRRAYTLKDIEIIRRIKTMMRHEGMTSRGARVKLSQELRETGRPKNTHEMMHLVDRIADEARAILRLFDEETTDAAQ